MTPVLNFPQALAVTGQSGAGKGTAVSILLKWCETAGISVCYISTGQLILDCIALGTPMAQKMRVLNSQGKLNPYFVMTSLLFNEIVRKYQSGQLLLLDGIPRTKEAVDILHQWLQLGFIESLKVMEIMTNDNLCFERIFARTKEDKREELSVDGQTGVPDSVKIQTKMDWWTANKTEIRRELILRGTYLSVHNEGTLIDFKNQLCELLTKKAAP